MPTFGIERINVRKSQPNPRIAFIRTMELPDRSKAQDFLERLAASVVPIMKKHYLSVMALCDFPANKEFLGRNFNGGERIDLILKSNSGSWLPFKFVQGVLIHELAHCVQMNHSKAFWKVRQEYHDELKDLWAKNYTGEGLWGRGVDLESGEFLGGGLADGFDLPEHLCGGTFRSSKKRKGKAQLSYKEQKERRVAKKFGVNGVALGADDEVKVKLEQGKRPVGKPRVAGSARGRELRAAAALARFEVKKEEELPSEDMGSETESDYEDAGFAEEAKDIDGKRLLDEKGHGVVKVCGDEDVDVAEAKNEMAELQGYSQKKNVKAFDLAVDGSLWRESLSSSIDPDLQAAPPFKKPGPIVPSMPGSTRVSRKRNADSKKIKIKIEPDDDTVDQGDISTASEDDEPGLFIRPQHIKTESDSATESGILSSSTCQVCSMENAAGASTCIMCANVLDATRVSGVWKCASDICRGGDYLNCADVGVCGVCGSRKAS